MGYCGYQEELLHHHKCPTTSYSITACSVFRCTGGFVIALIPNGKGGENDVYPQNTEKVSNAAFTHFAKPYCTMKPVIITGKGNTERSARYPLDTCKRTRLLRLTV